MKFDLWFNPSLGAVGCCEVPWEQLGVQCLAQGHFDMQAAGTRDRTANLAVKGHSTHWATAAPLHVSKKQIIKLERYWCKWYIYNTDFILLLLLFIITRLCWILVLIGQSRRSTVFYFFIGRPLLWAQFWCRTLADHFCVKLLISSVSRRVISGIMYSLVGWSGSTTIGLSFTTMTLYILPYLFFVRYFYIINVNADKIAD